MTRTRRLIRQTLTVARRDFIATVFTPTFLIFLFAPLIMMSLAGIGGASGAAMADAGEDKARIVAIVPAAEGRRMQEVDAGLRPLFSESGSPPPLLVQAPGKDPAGEARAVFDASGYDVAAVLHGPLDRPTILYGAEGRRPATYLAALADGVLRAGRAGGAGPLSVATKRSIVRTRATAGGRSRAAFFTVFGIFLLTVLLAGQAVGTMAEERNNKVIEVLAAAVPLESVFLGKLLAMFGSACLFVAFWGTIAANVGSVLPAGFARAFHEVGPAVGGPAFLVLFFTYFAMAYLLLGAVFLSVGAQASTVREIQMLSLPITIVQVAMFGFASAAASRPGSWLATAAELFPLSSPFAMGARAANRPELWPHFAAVAWQLLWVSIVITLGARAFRRGVLQSGGPRLRRRRGAAGMSISPA